MKKKGNSGSDELVQIMSDPRLEREFETLFLRRLAHVPPDEWTDVQWDTIIVQTRKQGAPFWKRLASATTDLVDRRLNPIDWTNSFLVYNWEALKFRNPHNLPGLQDWHPRAVSDLLQQMCKKGFSFYVGSSKQWYEGRRKELGLVPCTLCEPPRRYLIRECPERAAEWATSDLSLPFLLHLKETEG